MAWVVDCEYVVEREEGDWTVANQGRGRGEPAPWRAAPAGSTSVQGVGCGTMRM